MKRLLLFDYTFLKKEMIKYFMVVFLSLVFILSAFAQSDKDKVVITGSSTLKGSIPPPPPAVEAGYKTLVFDDDFDSINSIDVDATKTPGFKWYVDRRNKITEPSAYSVSNSVLTVSSTGWSANWALSSFSPGGNTGHSFRYGYFEARIRFDPTLGKNIRGFPAWWAFSTYHSRINNPERWAELDFFEAYTSGYSDYDGSFVGTVHDWSDGSKIHYQNANNVQSLPKSTDFNQWHTYGCLWVPGKVTWYFDGVPLMTQNYSATAPPDPLPNAGAGSPTPPPAGTFSILDTDPQGMLLILGSDPQWPIYVDWVRVWQDEKNKTNF